MNDVKISNVDFASRQNTATSSSQPDPAERVQSSSVDQDVTIQAQEQVKQPQERAERVQEGQEQVREAVTRLNDYVQSVQRDLQFRLDEDSGKTVVTVLDRQSSEVVRQIPDEVALKLAQDLQQDEPLSLFNAKV